LNVPTIEYFVGFNEGLSYESSHTFTAARIAIPGYLSGLPRGLENSLAELLGRNYSQNVDEIRIRKSDLLISDISKPQYILAAIIFNALGAFTFSDHVTVELWGTKVIGSERYAAITVKVRDLQ
jgi:hypothetical protein